MSISPEQQEFITSDSPMIEQACEYVKEQANRQAYEQKDDNTAPTAISELLSDPKKAKSLKLALIAQEREKLMELMEQEAIQNPYERLYALIVLENSL